MMLNADATDILSVGVAVLLVATLIVWAWWYYRKTTHYKLSQAPFFVLSLFFTRVMWRTKISGTLPIADNQGAVIVCNHVSSIDPFFIQLATNRTVHWMVAREYSLHPALAWIFHILESIPVNRGGIDTAATKLAIRLAQSGGLVGLFPEGQINQTDEPLLPGRPGAAMIALKARVPVIPCFVSEAPYDGTEYGCFFMTANTRLEVGKPIDISRYYERNGDRAVLQDLTKEFLVAIAQLGGIRDFQPSIAGRRWIRDQKTTANAS